MSRATAYLHRFLREPNHESTKFSRIGNRSNPFDNTLTILKDPAHNRELHLIGTTNSSTLLAHRTRKLVKDLKPHSLFVQSTPEWWNHARHLDAHDQETFSQTPLPKATFNMENHVRGLVFKAKFYTWLSTLRLLADLPPDFRLDTPGLEVKYALQEAEQAGSKIVFGGFEFNRQTIEGLQNSDKLYFTNLLLNARKLLKLSSAVQSQTSDFYKALHVRGGEAFAESFDKWRANFMVYLLDRVAPHQKQVLIDNKDEELFYEIYRCPGEKIVAVVNQLHVTGVEARWRRATSTEEEVPQVSPVADMDIDALQERHLINEYLRERASKITKSEPSTGWDYIVQYHKENFEYERTRHTHHRSHEDIPEFGEQSHKKHH